MGAGLFLFLGLEFLRFADVFLFFDNRPAIVALVAAGFRLDLGFAFATAHDSRMIPGTEIAEQQWSPKREIIPSMNPETMVVLGLLVAAVVLFVSDRLRSDLIAMIILILAWSIGSVCGDLDTAGYVIEMSVPVLLGLAVLLLFSLWLIRKIYLAPRRLGEAAGRYRSARSGQKLTRGMIAVAEGDFARGEKMLARAASGSDSRRTVLL